MHFLINGLPQTITADGREYALCCDFRRWILITQLLGETQLPPGRKLALMIKIAGIENCPDDASSLAGALLGFAACGDADAQSGEASAPVFDFDMDGDAIFAGFWQVYGIDLTSVSMHWWKFISLLRSLPHDTEFMSRVALRTMDLSKIEDDTLRKNLRRARAKIRLKLKNGENDNTTI